MGTVGDETMVGWGGITSNPVDTQLFAKWSLIYFEEGRHDGHIGFRITNISAIILSI